MPALRSTLSFSPLHHIRYSLVISIAGFLLANVALSSRLAVAAEIGGTAHAWPDGRTYSEPPANAIDGLTNTFTWTTAGFNNSPLNYLGIAFNASAVINRIRLLKDTNCGSGSEPQWQCYKDLTIQYTVDEGPMENRNWINVSNLMAGYAGGETFIAQSVNVDGTVALDQHAESDGWGSLSFDGVAATGIRICFERTDQPQFYQNNHYKVFEFEVYNSDQAVPADTISWSRAKSTFE